MTGSVAHSILQVGLVLVLMVGLIFALAWLAKKTQGFGLQGGKHITLLQTLPLGQKEKAVLIELNGTQLLLVVTANQVSTLWTAPVAQGKPDISNQDVSIQTQETSFSNTLKTLLSKNVLTRDAAC